MSINTKKLYLQPYLKKQMQIKDDIPLFLILEKLFPSSEYSSHMIQKNLL